MDDADTTLSGSVLQIIAGTTGKARISMVDSLKEGTVRWFVAAARSMRRPDKLCNTGAQSLPKYC